MSVHALSGADEAAPGGPALLTPDEALARVLLELRPLAAHEVPVSSALDAVLAETVRAPLPLPVFDNSAMDGYAVRAEDLLEGRRLSVVGDLRAGQVSRLEVGAGEACRVMTGATVPRGADTVVPYEATRTPQSTTRCATALTAVAPSWVEVVGSFDVGAHVRRRGEDVRRGQVLAVPGTVVGPAEIALFSAVGIGSVQVTRPPVVAVLSTGDELSRPGHELAPGSIHDANGPALAALVRRAGGIPVEGALVSDDPQALVDRLEVLAGSVDLVVTSGGASGGVADVVARLGESRHAVEVLAVGMRPGKPMVVGRLAAGRDRGTERVTLIGLPGNPVAAMVAFEVFAGPAIARLRGLPGDGVRRLEAVAGDTMRRSPGRVCFARVRLEPGPDGRLVARSTGLGRHHGVRSLIGADALAVLAGDDDVVHPGDPVTVRLTSWSGAPGGADGLQALSAGVAPTAFDGTVAPTVRPTD